MRAVVFHACCPAGADGRSKPTEVEPVNGLGMGWCTANARPGPPSTPVVAWIVSSLAFAAAHVELAHVILVLPLGLWFGWLRRRTGSLWPSLIAHMVNNSLAVVAAALLDV